MGVSPQRVIKRLPGNLLEIVQHVPCPIRESVVQLKCLPIHVKEIGQLSEQDWIFLSRNNCIVSFKLIPRVNGIHLTFTIPDFMFNVNRYLFIFKSPKSNETMFVYDINDEKELK